MKVSVVIPVYNVKPYLERCVQSVLRQTYQDIEVILVDDGSKDGSGELCDQIALTDKRIRVIHQENQGLSSARNMGICSATGDYIIFLDADDLWLMEDGLEKLVQKNNPVRDMVAFKNVDIWSNNTKTRCADYNVEYLNSLSDAHTVFAFLIRTQKFRMSACFLMVRRQLLVEHEIFFPNGIISEDVPWSLRLWQHMRSVTFTNLEFYGYCHRAESLSTTVTLHSYKSYDTIFSYWKEQCDKCCINAPAIRIYLANLWVSRGNCYYKLNDEDKAEALSILKKHVDLLNHAGTPKAKRSRFLANTIGVKNTTTLLGIYWRLRNLRN